MVPRPVTPRDRGKSPVAAGKSHTSGPAVPTQAKMKCETNIMTWHFSEHVQYVTPKDNPYK